MTDTVGGCMFWLVNRYLHQSFITNWCTRELL